MDKKNDYPAPAEADDKATNKTKYSHYNSTLDKMQEGTHVFNVMRHLIDFGQITSYEAFLEYGHIRLASTIFVLKRRYGVAIETDMETRNNRYGKPVSYAKYILIGE